MPRDVISPEQRAQEAAELRKIFEELPPVNGKFITQEEIALEMQVTPGLMNQWLTGKKTPIPQKRLLWLAARLKFDPSRVRKNLRPAHAGFLLPENRIIAKKIIKYIDYLFTL